MNRKTIHGFLAHVVGFFAVIAPALMGSVHTWTRVIILFGGLFTFLIAIVAARTRHHRISLPFIFLMMIALGIVGLLQCIPLPVSWLETLSPHLADLRTRLGHRWSPLAYDTPNALLETYELLAMAGFLFAAYQVTREGTYTQRMVQIIAFGGALLAALALFHHFTGINRMYGLYTPQTASTFFVPFVNSNHAAGYYAFIFFVLLSLGIAEPSLRLRIFTLSAAILPFLAVLWTGSRAGIAALGVGIVFWRILNGFARDTTHSGTATFLILIGLVIAIPLMDFFVAPFLQTPAGLDEDIKWRMWKITWPLIKDHAWLGTGPGSFSSVFPFYYTLPYRMHMDYAENIVLQFAVDYGLMLAFVAGAIIVTFSIRYLRRIRLRVWKVGLLAAVSTLILQNLFDFNLEFPGTALPFFVVLGILSAQHYHNMSDTPKRTVRPVILWVPSLLLIVGAVFAILLYAVPYELSRERENVIAFSQQRNWAKMANQAAQAQTRHPADSFLAATRGYAETFLPQGTPLRWIGLASWLYPRHPYPDLMAARVLAAWKRPQQALLQYRLALEKGARLDVRLVEEIRSLLGKTKITDVVPIRLWKTLVPLLPENERAGVCNVLLEAGMPQLPCVQLLLRNALQRKDWPFVERLAAVEEGLSGSTPRLCALRIRALYEQSRLQEFEVQLQNALRRHPRSGVINAVSMIHVCRSRGTVEALKWAKHRIDSRMLAPSQAFFLSQAALHLTDPDSTDMVFWRRRVEMFASVDKNPKDIEAYKLLEFMFSISFCSNNNNTYKEVHSNQ